MIGYPKHLNTKQDYEYVIANFPKEKWLPDLKALLNVKDWYYVGSSDTKDSFISDDSHKIVENRAADTDNETYSQYELKVNPNAEIFRIGYTLEKVQTIINDTGEGR